MQRHVVPTRAELLGALAVFVAVAFVVQPSVERGQPKAQQAARMALTAAVADHGTLRIDRYEDVLGVDFTIRDGHLYSDKAPLQPLLAVPAYVAYRAVGGDPADVPRSRFDLGLWWVSVWSAALPAALLVVAMARLARPWSTRWALPAALALAAGSLVLPFGTVLFAHTSSALLVAAALLAWRDPPASNSRLALTGLLLGLAIANEYTTGVALVVIGVASILRDRWRAWWTAAGAAVPLLGLALYHWAILGSPLRVPYQYHNLELQNAGTTAPSWDRVWALLATQRGVFVLAPIVLLAVVGLVVAARERPDRRADVLVATALFVGFFLVQAGATDEGGEALGPRYMVPALPALAIGLAALWERRPTLCGGVAAISALVMTLATYTDPLPPVQIDNLLRHWIDLLADGRVVDTLFEPLIGRAAVPIVLVGAVALAALAMRADEREPADA